MAAFTLYYVDTASGVDSVGNGTSTGASAYATVQYALNDIGTTHGIGTVGNQINIKGDDTITTTLTLATYGAPATASPLVFKGYTTTANDGGQGAINGNNSVAIYQDTANDYVYFVNMRL